MRLLVSFFLLIKFEISIVSSVGMVFSLMNVFSSLALASSLSSKPAFRSAEASNLSLFRFFNFTNMPGDRRYLLFKIGFTRVLGLGGSFGSFGSP